MIIHDPKKLILGQDFAAMGLTRLTADSTLYSLWQERPVFCIVHDTYLTDEFREHLYRVGIEAFGVELLDGDLVTDEGATFCCAPGMPGFSAEQRAATNAGDFDTWLNLCNASISHLRWEVQYSLDGIGQSDWASVGACSVDGLGVTITLPEDLMRRVFRDIGRSRRISQSR